MEEKRDTRFAAQIRTRIWHERCDPANPWNALDASCHGYALGDMVGSLSFHETLFLLLHGELPTPEQGQMLQKFLVAFCNPGPRHAATRAVMNAAASGTLSSNLPAIGLSILSGDHLGSGEVAQAVQFIKRNLNKDPQLLATSLLADTRVSGNDADIRVAPGFGTLHGSPDAVAGGLAEVFREAFPAAPAIDWAQRFAQCLHIASCGWLMPGIAAAIAVDIGLNARTAGLLFQLANLPGLIAHGLEMAGKGINALPFVPEENYVLLE